MAQNKAAVLARVDKAGLGSVLPVHGLVAMQHVLEHTTGLLFPEVKLSSTVAWPSSSQFSVFEQHSHSSCCSR
jgi:hypothetical protein